MIPAPLAILLIAAVAFQISPETFSWSGFLVFSVVAFGVWIALHVVLGRLLAWVAHQRAPMDALMAETLAKHGSGDESMARVMQDPVYQIAFVVSVIAKWTIVTWVAWTVVF